MQYKAFIERVQNRSDIASSEAAVRITEAVLETLGERLYRTERENLIAQLPHGLKEPLAKPLGAEPFTLEELYNRVKARAELGYPDAVRLSRVVIGVLAEAVSQGEIENILSQLPDEFEELFGKEPEGPLSPTIGRETVSRLEREA